MKLRGVWSKPFHGAKLRAIGLDRKHQTSADGFIVQEHGACAADAVLTADVGSRESEIVTNIIHQKFARFRLASVLASIDCHANVSFAHLSFSMSQYLGLSCSQSPRGCLFQDSPRQHLGDFLTVFGAGVNI